MACVEIIAVGTEILLGELTDTNTARIARSLAASGLDVYATHAVGDNRERIAAAVRTALARADGVITTGGLGPTIDDLTKEAVCDVLHCDTELHEPSLQAMAESFARSGRVMRANNRKQAEVPRGAYVLRNAHGTAPGFVVRSNGKFVACLPGVPHEMRAMLRDGLVPWLREQYAVRDAIFTRTLHTINLAESEIDHRIDDLFRTLENPKVAVLAHDFRCDVKLTVKAASQEAALAALAPVEHEVLRRLGGHVYGVDEQTLAGAIHVLLAQTRRTVAVAESCTAGSIAAALASVPGASKTFAGGVVAYSDGVKIRMLQIEPALIERDGAVSSTVACAMAAAVREELEADLGLSVTGIAGPSGGTAEKPVGLVFVALADRSGARPHRLQLHGDRARIQGWATVASLGLLWKLLERGEPIQA